MTFNIHPTQIPYQITKTKQKTKTLHIQWFTQNTQALQDIINFYESKQNQMRKHILSDLITKIEQYYTAPAEKQALQHAMALYYPFQEQDPLQHKYPLKGQYLPLIKKPADLRIEFFSTHPNYTPPTKHRNALATLAKNHNTTPAHLKRALYANYKPNHVLVKQNTPTPDELTGHINYAYLTNLAKLATQITITLPHPKNLPSTILKQAIAHAKKTLIWVDIRQHDNSTILTMQQLNETLHKTKEINTQLAQNLRATLTPIITTNTPFTLIMDLKPKPRTLATFTIKHEDLSQLKIPLALTTTPQNTNQEFDSKIETQFNTLLTKTQTPWKFTPQPLIIENDLIYIPDFTATHPQNPNKTPILIEIAGYYTKQYLTKKQAKLKKLQQKYDIIILTPKENKQWFTPLNTTIITYDPNKPLPYQRLIHELNKKHAPQITTQTILTHINTTTPTTLKDLATCTNLTPTQLHDILNNPTTKQALKTKQLQYIPKCGIIPTQTINTIQQTLKTYFAQNPQPTPIHELQALLKTILPPQLEYCLPQILTTLNYALEYKDLVTLIVKPPN